MRKRIFAVPPIALACVLLYFVLNCAGDLQSLSLGSFTHWFMNALISGLFPLMAASSGGIPFAFFAGMMLLQFVVVLTIYPETKGVSLEEMQTTMGIT